MTPASRQEAWQTANQLWSTAEDFIADRIDYDTFQARQVERWNAIEARGKTFKAQVLRGLRKLERDHRKLVGRPS